MINQSAMKAEIKIANRVTYNEYLDGFDKFGGTTTPTSPNIIRVVSDGRTIIPSWDSQFNITNHSHYEIQCSEDRLLWYALNFQGRWKDELDESTIVYGNTISHTRVPHSDDGSVRTLYYRVRSVTLLAKKSDWSIEKEGNTNWYGAADIRESGVFVYGGVGYVIGNGYVTAIGPDEITYDGLGYCILSGNADSGEVNDYSYTSNITCISSGGGVYELESIGLVTFGADYQFSSSRAEPESVDTFSDIRFITTFVGDNSQGSAIIGLVNDTMITYGLPYVFNTNSQIESDVAVLDTTHFIVAYDGVGDYGTARVATVNGNIISYGTEYVFSSGWCQDITVNRIDDTHSLIVYKSATSQLNAVVATISGNAISYGTSVVFNASVSTRIETAMISSTKFVTVICDYLNNKRGLAFIGTISGTTITPGIGYEFNDSEVDYLSVESINDDKFIVSYQADAESDYGKSRVGSITGYNTITFGSEYIFNEATTSHTSMVKVGVDKVAIAYRDKMKLATITGTDISYGPENHISDNNDNCDRLTLLQENVIVSVAQNGSYPWGGTGIVGKL